MSSNELSEWMAFDRIYPLPDPYRVGGILASTMVNLWSKEKVSEEDFIPRRKPPRDPGEIERRNKEIMMGLWRAQRARG